MLDIFGDLEIWHIIVSALLALALVGSVSWLAWGMMKKKKDPDGFYLIQPALVDLAVMAAMLAFVFTASSSFVVQMVCIATIGVVGITGALIVRWRFPCLVKAQ